MESGGGRVTGSSLHAQSTMLQWIVGQVNNAATQKKITYQHCERIIQNLHQFNIRRNHLVVTANAIQEPLANTKGSMTKKRGESKNGLDTRKHCSCSRDYDDQPINEPFTLE